MAAGLDCTMGTQKDSLEMEKYLGLTYRCIHWNLQQNKNPSDATVAAVMSLTIHADLLGDLKRSKLHIDALCNMIRMRGGLGVFDKNRILMQKICR